MEDIVRGAIIDYSYAISQPQLNWLFNNVF
jgi:hypothetical protein